MSTGRPRSIPSYRKHKQSGQALVCLTDPLAGRKDYLLGPYGSAASKRMYERLIVEWLANGRRLSPPASPTGPGITINELVHRFRDHAERFYIRPDGSQTNEVTEFRYSLKPVRELYGLTRVDAFTPLGLKSVRQKMIDSGWSRGVINRRIGRVKHAFRWAVSEGLVPVAVLQALDTVSGLPRGRGVRETEAVGPVSDAAVAAVRPFLSRTVWGLVEFQRLTGCRPGEACIARACDFDTTGSIWLYRPAQHKTAWKNRPRVIAVGPKCQELVRSFLTTRIEDYLFSPARARAERFAAMRAARKTPVQPSQVSRAKPRPQRRPGDRYRTSSYQHAITKACQRAGIAPWSPLQLRHSHATLIRRQFGLEAASVSLGHGSAALTDAVYAERDLQLVLKVAREVG
jgi:integrase